MFFIADSSGPWDSRVRERRKNDSDNPKPTTRSHTSPSSLSQSPYYHPAFTDPHPSDDYASVSTQTDYLLRGDEKVYERDNSVATDQGTLVEKGKYRGDGVDRREYSRNFARSLEHNNREYYSSNFTPGEGGTGERRRYGRDSSTAGKQETINEEEYDRDSLRLVDRSVEEREYSYGDFDISNDETEYNRDILMSPNQGYGKDSLITVERESDDLDIHDSDQSILLPSEVEKQRSRLLRDRIRKCHDVEEVFALHRKHRTSMGVNHILLVLERLAGFVSDRWVSFIEPFSLLMFRLLQCSPDTLGDSGKAYPCTHTNNLQSFLQVVIAVIRNFLY